MCPLGRNVSDPNKIIEMRENQYKLGGGEKRKWNECQCSSIYEVIYIYIQEINEKCTGVRNVYKSDNKSERDVEKVIIRDVEKK